MSIHTKSNNEPFYFHPRKLSYYEKTQVDKIINKIIKDKIIQRSCSSYSSPIVLVKKKTGDSRLCIVYRKLNKITIRDNFPSPKIENKIYLLRDKHFFFAKLHLKSNLYCVQLNNESVKLTSFAITGQYEFVKMPFGLKNSPLIFIRYINRIFKDLIGSGEILTYIDDIFIVTRDINYHFNILRKMLQVYINNLLFLNLISMYIFLFKTISYLINMISCEVIRLDV